MEQRLQFVLNRLQMGIKLTIVGFHLRDLSLFPFSFIFVQIKCEIMSQKFSVTMQSFPIITGHGTEKVLLMKWLNPRA